MDSAAAIDYAVHLMMGQHKVVPWLGIALNTQNLHLASRMVCVVVLYDEHSMNDA